MYQTTKTLCMKLNLVHSDNFITLRIVIAFKNLFKIVLLTTKQLFSNMDRYSLGVPLIY